MDLVYRIIRVRREKKLSQQALSTMIKVSRSALAQWEAGLTRPNLENLKKMAEVLEVSFEWLATGRGNQHYVQNKNELSDYELSSEITRILPSLTVKRKKAVLDIIKEMQ